VEKIVIAVVAELSLVMAKRILDMNSMTRTDKRSSTETNRLWEIEETVGGIDLLVISSLMSGGDLDIVTG